MEDIQQLIKKDNQGSGYKDIYPKSYTEAIRDRETGELLNVILSRTNFLFLPYIKNKESTRLLVPMSMRRNGLWISYVTYEGKLVIEYYLSDNITDNYWKNNSFWFDTTGKIVDPDIASAVEEIREYVNATTNLNEEDLERNNSLQIQFANKEYNPSDYSGLGRIYLRKNIIEGKNILTQDMISKPNVRYIIQYEYDLDGKTVKIPKGCILDFQGGSISNGSIAVDYIFNIVAPSIKIFDNIDIINGDVNINRLPFKLNVCWFGAKGDYYYGCESYTDNTEVIQKIIDWGFGLYFPAGYYGCNNSISFENTKYQSVTGDSVKDTALVYLGNDPNTSFVLFHQMYCEWDKVGIVLPNGYSGKYGIHFTAEEYNIHTNIINFTDVTFYIHGGWNAAFYSHQLGIQYSNITINANYTLYQERIPGAYKNTGVHINCNYIYGCNLSLNIECFTGNGVELEVTRNSNCFTLEGLVENGANAGYLSLTPCVINNFYSEAQSPDLELRNSSCVIIEQAFVNWKIINSHDITLNNTRVAEIDSDSYNIFFGNFIIGQSGIHTLQVGPNIKCYTDGFVNQSIRPMLTKYGTVNFASNNYKDKTYQGKNNITICGLGCEDTTRTSLFPNCFKTANYVSGAIRIYLNVTLEYAQTWFVGKSVLVSFKFKPIGDFDYLNFSIIGQTSTSLYKVAISPLSNCIEVEDGWYLSTMFIPLSKTLTQTPAFDLRGIYNSNGTGGACYIAEISVSFNRGINIGFVPNLNENTYCNIDKGSTENRPILNKDYSNFQYFDTTLNKPIWWTGSKWVDAIGTDVDTQSVSNLSLGHFEEIPASEDKIS